MYSRGKEKALACFSRLGASPHKARRSEPLTATIRILGLSHQILTMGPRQPAHREQGPIGDHVGTLALLWPYFALHPGPHASFSH